MKINNGIFVIVAVLIILLPVGYSMVDAVVSTATKGDELFLTMPADHKECVDGKNAKYMRYHHMDYLHKVKNDAVRKGIREKPGITSCGECHTSQEKFCNKCHEAVNLNLNCFRCHHYPES